MLARLAPPLSVHLQHWCVCSFPTRPHAGQAGGGLDKRSGVVSRVITVQLICPCLIGPKDLMRRCYPAAVGDTANAGSDKVFVVNMRQVHHERPQLTPGVCWTGRGGLARKVRGGLTRNYGAVDLSVPDWT